MDLGGITPDDLGLARKLANLQQQAQEWQKIQEEQLKMNTPPILGPSHPTTFSNALADQYVTHPASVSAEITQPQSPEEESFQIHQAIARNEKERRLLMWVNAKLLSHMEETDSYKTILGDPEGKWVQYLAQLEVFYPRSTIYKMVRIYRKLTKELEISENHYDDIPVNRLFDVVKFIETTDAEDWFAKARVLTTRDWNIELRLKKGLITEEQEHEHIDEEFGICTVCGRKEKIHSEEEGDDNGKEEEASGPVV